MQAAEFLNLLLVFKHIKRHRHMRLVGRHFRKGLQKVRMDECLTAKPRYVLAGKCVQDSAFCEIGAKGVTSSFWSSALEIAAIG